MKRLTLLALFLLLSATLSAQAPKAKRPPNPSLAPIEDVAGLPRVLLIGDSISMGYTLPVRQRLAGRANVHRIPANGGPTKNGVARLDAWLGAGRWDVIHFNHGIHDLRFMDDGQRQVGPADYEANLRKIVARLKQTGATLVWATITGYLVFASLPDRWTLVGAAIIIASGLYTAHRERLRSRQRNA